MSLRERLKNKKGITTGRARAQIARPGTQPLRAFRGEIDRTHSFADRSQTERASSPHLADGLTPSGLSFLTVLSPIELREYEPAFASEASASWAAFLAERRPMLLHVRAWLGQVSDCGYPAVTRARGPSGESGVYRKHRRNRRFRFP